MLSFKFNHQHYLSPLLIHYHFRVYIPPIVYLTESDSKSGLDLAASFTAWFVLLQVAVCQLSNMQGLENVNATADFCRVLLIP